MKAEIKIFKQKILELALQTDTALDDLLQRLSAEVESLKDDLAQDKIPYLNSMKDKSTVSQTAAAAAGQSNVKQAASGASNNVSPPLLRRPQVKRVSEGATNALGSRALNAFKETCLSDDANCGGIT